MSISLAPSLSPVVFQLAAGLEQYEMEVDDLIRSSFDPGRCARVGRELARIRKLSGALPQLAADAVEVAIRHVELFRLLVARPCTWAEASCRAEIVALRASLVEVIESMRTKCLRLLAREEGVTPAV